MPASIQNPADLVNLALSRIGYARRVGNLFDGSDAANAALTVYAQTRDDMLRDGEWDFCRRTSSPTLLKTAPSNYFDAPWNPATNPPWPWKYEYEYPSDCLKVRSVNPMQGFLVAMSPEPNLFQVLNDNGGASPARVIVCNIPDMVLIYTGQVTNPAQWPADFVEAFAAMLGAKLKPLLVGNVTQMDAAQTAESVQSAMQEQG